MGDVVMKLTITSKGDQPEIKEKIIDMVINESGIRDTSRILKVS